MKTAKDNNERNPTGASGAAETADTVAFSAMAEWLSQKPEVVIPEGFAARVQKHVFAQPRLRKVRFSGWGPRLAVASAGVLTTAMFALAPHVTPSISNLAFDGEMLLLAELGGLLLFSTLLLARD